MTRTPSPISAIHHAFDQVVDRVVADYTGNGGSIHCRSCCANCCSLAVHTTFPEAQLIAAQLDSVLHDALLTYIDKLRIHQAQCRNFKEYLRLHLTTLGPCPLLAAEGHCSVYALRPLTCRALLATRPASWCGVDFATLDRWDKQLYQQALDRDAVAWPTHYLAVTQDYAAEQEVKIARGMRDTYGFSLSGNLPLLVWLARQADIVGILSAGAPAILAFIAAHGIAPDRVVTVGED